MIDKEQRNNIKKDIERSIVHIARTHGVYNDEIRSILIDDYVDEDDFIIIPWPEVQELMPLPGFDINASLATDEWTMSKYGSSAYFVNKQWLNSL